MKNYLLITPLCPYPPHKNGGVHTIYNILVNKPGDVNIDIIYFYEKADLDAEQNLKFCVRKIKSQLSHRKTNILVRATNFFKGRPDMLAGINTKSPVTVEQLKKYDVVVLDQVASLEFMKYVREAAHVLVMMHDSQILMYERKIKADRGIIKKIYDKFQCAYFSKYEKKTLDKCERIIYVSRFDKEYTEKIHPEYTSKLEYMNLGVEIPDNTRISRNKRKNSIIFSGVMDYEPNEDAALYFAKDIMPELVELIPDCIFTIAGKNPTSSVMEIKNEKIHVTGFVDDMVSTITQSEIYVSPLRFGSGMKNKVLEAMAAGMPVILSPVSCDGIDGLIDGENCLFANDKEEWVNKIKLLVDDDELKDKIAKNGKELVTKNHSWNAVFNHFLV